MIDIHHHLLPGLDDGSRDLEMSLAMVEMAIADGITHIACTPHSSHRYYFDPEINATAFATLQDAVQTKFGDRITLGLGCDFHLMYDNIEDAQRHPTRYTINGHNYLLVEFPDSAISPNTAQTFYQLSLSGMTPIVTHPERNPILSRQPERMWEWLQAGALIQVTASSFTGRFGKQAEQAALWLLDHRWIHFIATDAHNTGSRPPLLRPAFDFVTEHCDLATAQRLCIHNPRAAFYGEALDALPEPIAPSSSEPKQRSKSPRRGFLGRLFGR